MKLNTNKIEKIKYKNRMLLTEKEYLFNFGLVRCHFEEQIRFIQTRIEAKHGFNSKIKICEYNFFLQENITFKNKIDETWMAICIFSKACTNGCNIKEIINTFGVSRKFIKKYLVIGSHLAGEYYENYFTSKDYWTESVIKSHNLKDYSCLLGYV